MPDPTASVLRNDFTEALPGISSFAPGLTDPF